MFVVAQIDKLSWSASILPHCKAQIKRAENHFKFRNVILVQPIFLQDNIFNFFENLFDFRSQKWDFDQDLFDILSSCKWLDVDF